LNATTKDYKIAGSSVISFSANGSLAFSLGSSAFFPPRGNSSDYEYLVKIVDNAAATLSDSSGTDCDATSGASAADFKLVQVSVKTAPNAVGDRLPLSPGNYSLSSTLACVTNWRIIWDDSLVLPVESLSILMFVLSSLLAAAVWFTKPPQGSQARTTVNHQGASTIFLIVGINKEGYELGSENFSASPDQLTVGNNSSRQSFIRFNPYLLWPVCAVPLLPLICWTASNSNWVSSCKPAERVPAAEVHETPEAYAAVLDLPGDDDGAIAGGVAAAGRVRGLQVRLKKRPHSGVEGHRRSDPFQSLSNLSRSDLKALRGLSSATLARSCPTSLNAPIEPLVWPSLPWTSRSCWSIFFFDLWLQHLAWQKAACNSNVAVLNEHPAAVWGSIGKLEGNSQLASGQTWLGFIRRPESKISWIYNEKRACYCRQWVAPSGKLCGLGSICSLGVRRAVQAKKCGRLSAAADGINDA
jgi:hypothetical protein